MALVFQKGLKKPPMSQPNSPRSQPLDTAGHSTLRAGMAEKDPVNQVWIHSSPTNHLNALKAKA